jgi:hypothetical protein
MKQGKISKNLRKTLVSLIIQDVHANDVIGYADWGEKYYFNTSPKLYDGKKNTEIIANKCSSAARICK